MTSLEAVVRWCFVRKVVLKTSETLQCQSLFFNKVAGLRKAKKESLAQVFSCEFCEISKNILFYRTPPVAASVTHIILLEIYQPDVGITVI